MEAKNEIINSIWNKLGRVNPPHYVFDLIAGEFFSLIPHKEEQEVKDLFWKFKINVSEVGCERLLKSNYEYGIRVSNFCRETIYEEMNLLFSICEAIYVYESLGLCEFPVLKEQFKEVVLRALNSEKKLALNVIKDRTKEFNHQFWWYKLS